MLDANLGGSFVFLKFSKVFSWVCAFLPETDVGIRKIALVTDQLFQEHEGARPFSRTWDHKSQENLSTQGQSYQLNFNTEL